MKIDVIASEGSPLNVTEQSIYGIDGRKGVGGAELGILTLCRLWTEAGHNVTLYNNGKVGNSIFHHEPPSVFNPHVERDVVICFRTPDERIRHTKAKKIWYSNDQFTRDDYSRFSKLVDKVVCISPHHKEYFKQMYNIFNTEVVDIPVRTWEYEKVTKRKNSCLYSSVPDRGLLHLAPIWKRIVEKVPDATLTITGDWSLWNGMDYSNELHQYRRAFAGMKNVNYLSAINRKDLIKIQQESEFFLYPHVSQYPELYCISLAEAQVAGAIPITSRIGAMETTNRFGYKIDGHPQDQQFREKFAEVVVGLMNVGKIPDIRDEASVEFGKDKILAQWERMMNE